MHGFCRRERVGGSLLWNEITRMIVKENMMKLREITFPPQRRQTVPGCCFNTVYYPLDNQSIHILHHVIQRDRIEVSKGVQHLWVCSEKRHRCEGREDWRE